MLVTAIWSILITTFPRLAGNLALYIFTRPIKAKRKHSISRPGYLSQKLTVGRKSIHYLKPQKNHDGYVALFHGWMGKVEQFDPLVTTLESQGIGCILVDMPAHGQSSGTRTDARDFSRVIHTFNTTFQLEGIVCHSLAGLATAISADELDSRYKKVVMVSSPSSGLDILKDFMTRLKAPRSLKKPLRTALLEQYDLDFDEFHGAHLLEQNAGAVENLLVLHDKNDQAVPAKDGQAYAQAWGTECQFTENLGHNRILKDPGVIKAIAEFLS